MLGRFTAAEREHLMRHPREWRSSLLARQGINQVAHKPIIEMHGDRMVLRFSTLDIVADDELTRRYVATGREFFESAKVAVKIARGAILAWDNWRMMHARNGFSDPHRHLRRVLVGASP
jgi:alpha-ketoglutarate-dependent taurine dioxygenase